MFIWMLMFYWIKCYCPLRPRSVGVGRTFGSVCFFVYFFIWSITQKRIISKCSNLTRGFPRSGIVLGIERSKVNVSAFFTLMFAASKANDPKVFKLGIGNDSGISYKWYGFQVERSKVKVRIRVNSNMVWVRTLWEPFSCEVDWPTFCFLLRTTGPLQRSN